MTSLILVKGPNAGRRFSLPGEITVIGRQPDSAIYLEELAVSRQHARIVCENGAYYIEDLNSANGTWLNGVKQKPHTRVPLTESDELQVGPYVLNLHVERPPETQSIIRARIDAGPSSHTLFAQNPAQKLSVVMEIAQNLGHVLDLDPLLGRLLEHLLRLFPQADRGMVLLCERDQLVVRAQRTRFGGHDGDYPYSRTVVRKALDEGAALLSEDLGSDLQITSQTLVSLNLRSFLCVPLIGWENRRLGVIQLDCLRHGQALRAEDLELLAAIALQVSVVLQNAAYHGQRLLEERLRQELLLAREVQQAFLPRDFPLREADHAELFARVHPAREVSGDLYDMIRLPDGRVVFYLGDVSGKGMPAALFMIAVHTLSRHLAPSTSGPAELLHRLNKALQADNPTHLFVTLICGFYDGRDGSVLLASGAHPPPLLRKPDGTVEALELPNGVMLGKAFLDLRVSDTRIVLQPGETLILYTDGLTEACAPDGTTEFGLDRLREALGGPRTDAPLEQCAEEACAAIARFTRQEELQDDQTLLLLRRK
jgi:serine phosphatase RsbU (regulator of sigma subunit)